MRYLFLLFSCLHFIASFAPEEVSKTSINNTFFSKIDSLYREDQFYVGITYNLVTNAPSSFRQKGFSSGISAGFLRDMPINKNRTYAIAVGAGLSYANYQQNLVINDESGAAAYEIRSGSEISKGKLEQLFIELPIEFRWRNSTPTSYKFWRIHTGFKLQYLIFDKSRFEGDDFSYRVTNNNDLNKLQFGPYIAVGFNTWNFQAYYGVNPMFKNVTTNEGEAVKMKTLNIGLMFYVL